MHNAIRIETRSVASIHASSYQARTHNKKQQLKTERSLRRFGFVQPLLITGTGEIVDGHLRFELAPRIGYDEVPVIIVDHLSPPEIRALRLALNRIPLDAGWDDTKLRSEFAALLDLGMDLDLTGFDAPEIDMRLSVDEPEGEAVEELPQSLVEPAGPAISRVGDRWALGPHRNACADARDQAVFVELLGAKTAAAGRYRPPLQSEDQRGCFWSRQDAPRGICHG
jgi:ParB-like chromosome segregation protein Spo0J